MGFDQRSSSSSSSAKFQILLFLSLWVLVYLAVKNWNEGGSGGGIIIVDSENRSAAAEVGSISFVVWTNTSTAASEAIATATNINQYDKEKKESTSNLKKIAEEEKEIVIHLVIALGGELGNYLLPLMQGYATKLFIEEQLRDLNVRIQLMGQHKDEGKWIRPVGEIQQCFPMLSASISTFEGGTWLGQHYKHTTNKLNSWLKRLGNKTQDNDLDWDHSNNVTILENSLQTLRQLVEQQIQQPNNTQIHHPQNQQQNNISLPYLRLRPKMALLMTGERGPLIEHYHKQIQKHFAFDSAACCSNRRWPAPDETIFHFRNFAAESARGIKSIAELGFVEVGPNHVASVVLQEQQQQEQQLPPPVSNGTYATIGTSSSSSSLSTNSNNNDHHHYDEYNNNNNQQHQQKLVTLITRQYKNKPKAADQHISSLIKSGDVHLRVIQDHSGVQDYCMLLHANHIVASRISTFAMTAAILGNQSSVIVYLIDTPIVRQNKKEAFQPLGWGQQQQQQQEQYNNKFGWSSNNNNNVDQTLQNRFQFQIYPEEYKD